MRESNDVGDTEQTFLDSLGVLDLDLSFGPDAFGPRAFDEEMPKTRMLPGSGPCDLRLLIPDVGLGQMGFHDVVIENLLGTSVWRSKHVTPADVIGLRQRWPKAVFHVMRERSVELEDLRRKAFVSSQPAYLPGRGYCPVCKTKSDDGLDAHMMCHHLDLGQLWRCPVEWCAVWKGSVRECRDHFNDKHSGSETIDFDQVSKAFPSRTVPRDFWKQALQPEISGIAVDVMLFRESGRKLVHKYRVYRDPLPHPALQVDFTGQPGHGNCTAYPVTDSNTGIGKCTGGSTNGLLPWDEGCHHQAGHQTGFFRGSRQYGRRPDRNVASREG